MRQLLATSNVGSSSALKLLACVPRAIIAIEITVGNRRISKTFENLTYCTLVELSVNKYIVPKCNNGTLVRRPAVSRMHSARFHFRDFFGDWHTFAHHRAAFTQTTRPFMSNKHSDRCVSICHFATTYRDYARFERVTSTNQCCRLAMSQNSKLALVIKLTAVAAAILLAGLSVLNDARARGRSGGYPGGKVKSSWHWHNGYSHNRYKNRHSNPRQESRDHAPLGSQQGQPPRFQGTWHSSPAFGGHNQKPSRFQGEWEGSPGFGSQEQTHTSSNHHRQ